MITLQNRFNNISFRCNKQKTIRNHNDEYKLISFIFSCCKPSALEEWTRETLCGRTPDGAHFSWKSHPWFVALRYNADNSQKDFYTGTLISNMHIVTAAEIFPKDRRDANKWSALPGAYNIDNINTWVTSNLFGSNWAEINSISIHPSYDAM